MIRLGLIGIGRGAMVKVVKERPGLRLAAVFDPLFEGRDAAASRQLLDERGLECEKAYGDFDAFMAHDMDVVFVASPAPFHAEQCVAILRSGRHAISEVPAAMSLEEARALVMAVRESGRRYLFAENCCYWGFVRAWTRLVADGRVGTPYYIEGEYVHDVQYLMRDAAGRPTWRASLNPIRYCTHETGPIFDIIADRGVRVTAAATPSLVNPEFPAADAGVALVTTSRGAVVKLLACFKNRVSAYHRYLLFGTEGSLETKSTDHITRATFTDIPHLGGPVQLPLGCGLKGWGGSGGHGGADEAMLHDFLDCLERDLPCPLDVYRGLDYTLPGICADLSIEQGGAPVEIPDPRTFV